MVGLFEYKVLVLKLEGDLVISLDLIHLLGLHSGSNRQLINYYWRSFRNNSNWVLFRPSQREGNVCYVNVSTKYMVEFREKLASASSDMNW